ncbi:MAG TPA: IS200/IS605 family transposase [Opitutaceae bacterium]|nr:IS200/IS605 family transposase [Opitutaceae bacterium]
MTHSLCLVTVHIVFSTKDRQPLLTKEFQPRVWAYLSKILHNMGCTDITIGGIEDHIHALCNLGKQCKPALLMQDLKSDSSKWTKELDPKLSDFYWQTGYGMFSVSSSHREAVRAYIETQEEHHKTEDFKEEYLRMLSEHNIAVDERYLWD